MTAISIYLAFITIARNEGCFDPDILKGNNRGEKLLIMHPQTVNAWDGRVMT